MTFKKCRNEGCEIQIEVRNTAEGWRPFEESGNKHQCQYSDYAKKQKQREPISSVEFKEEKDDHGNELVQDITKTESPKEMYQRMEGKTSDDLTKGYVDHTQPAKGTSKCIIFFSSQPTDVMDEYNQFLANNKDKIKTQGAHDHITKDDDGMLFSIFLYYEESAKQ